ncbi:MAG: DUF411 domain-containing protein [Bradyrhizobium sp.]|uniref:DUF411 domain-containing protein n=1 Tax=Bradyrhizobium sp. TaxID=376 RepID=UPI0025B82DEC|nr:DUF411 domain-containing protein [Bradyrhizobium sp.]MBI5263019.1 DUF411 domain-containing protein [Bradyrhizobium sp.]
MTGDAHRLHRRSVLGLVVALALGQASRPILAAEPVIKVHKDPNCGCCTGWVQHLRDAGFAVEVEETSDLEQVRSRLGVPPELAACHTAEMHGYLIEGHVPALAVRRLLAERPNARGIAVPGMPVGSPGMEGEPAQPYTVILFGADGQRPFMRFVREQAIG